MKIRKANDREGSCPEGGGGGGGSYPSMQSRRGDVQEGKCPFTHKISLTHLIENVHSLTMHIFKEKKKRNTFHNQTFVACVYLGIIIPPITIIVDPSLYTRRLRVL